MNVLFTKQCRVIFVVVFAAIAGAAYLRAEQAGKKTEPAEQKESPASDLKIDPAAASQEIDKAATTFFEDLRNESRDVALGLLTDKAQAILKEEKGPLMILPKPSAGPKALKNGKVQLEGSMAEVQVRVHAGGKYHNTKLHFRHEESGWRVFAISATYPDGERSINFEAVGVKQTRVDPAEALLGQKLELTGLTADGSQLDMAKFEGKVVLVDFWASWCPPCRAEMPNILSNWKKYHDKGFDVIAISMDDDMKDLGSFLSKQQLPWTVVADLHPTNKESMGAKYRINAYPTFLLLDKEGKVAAIHCRGKRLGQEVARLLGEQVSDASGAR